MNRVRSRADLPDASASSVNQLVDLILDERKFEFAIEGHRFFDMTRTGKAVEVFANLPRTTGASLYSIGSTGKYVFPIPTSEMLNNSKMVQNPAYR